MFEESFGDFESKMRAAGVSGPAIAAFHHNYSRLVSGDAGLIPEDQIQPVESLPSYTDIARGGGDSALFSQLLVVKLNGGLGTSMGLERAKSLLTVKQGLTFMDLIVRQILHWRVRHRTKVRFALMNSFSTGKDTFEALKKYPDIGEPFEIELMQSQVPKVDARTLKPISWPENPHLEWCPPGHGDFYTSLYSTGMMDRLLAEGVKYVFISNSDNLGATPDVSLLTYFARTGLEFMMEVAARTQADRKGGHLAARGKTLLLRESAQCPEQDMEHFQDVERHRFFNTNNLWLRLDALQPLLKQNGGFLPLPLIKNTKTVDPRKKSSPVVFQLETAMGAAIQAFARPGAVLVPRSRFAPVKTTNDLLALRSDAYRLTEDWRIVLENSAPNGQPPDIDLDPALYKMVDGLEALIADGVPSLRDCSSLKVRGPVQFSSKLIFRGCVGIVNAGSAPAAVPPGTYQDREWSPA